MCGVEKDRATSALTFSVQAREQEEIIRGEIAREEPRTKNWALETSTNEEQAGARRGTSRETTRTVSKQRERSMCLGPQDRALTTSK